VTQKIRCRICKNETVIDLHSLLSADPCCDSCGTSLEASLVDAVPHSYEESIPVLRVGEIVKISNEQHVWHGEIGIIRNKKHKQYRIEVLGKLLWVPEHWVQTNDTDDFS
jgi:transcription initiation factor TFIIIB Brf1 subunit/transcription initiation factor TFIIB